MKPFLLVAFGGALGSIARYGLSLLLNGKSFPWATLSVNIVGSFIIGVVAAIALANENFNNQWRLLLATGICGGFTTFSAFTLENLQLIQEGKWLQMATYTSLSLLGGLIAVWLGYKIGSLAM
ncbi:MAG: fluoride efflux transporter CrcB [Ferruginibacter sp.]